MAKTNKQVVEVWLRGENLEANGNNLRCDGEGCLYSYNLLIGAWESADMNGPRRPVLWKYQSSSVKAENARVSVTTSNHVGLVCSTAARLKVGLELRTPTSAQVQTAKARRGPRQGREGGSGEPRP